MVGLFDGIGQLAGNFVHGDDDGILFRARSEAFMLPLVTSDPSLTLVSL